MRPAEASEAPAGPAAPGSPLPEGYDYWAFLSYNHRDEDAAKWLHEKLETYKVPEQIVGRQVSYGQVPARLYPVLRDRDEFRGGASLTEQAESALRRSLHLVVVCSPDAAKSRWVNDEIRAFKALGRESRVLCLIVEGEPHASERPGFEHLECFPSAVRYRVDENGELTDERVEPAAADARRGKDGRANAILKLLAGLLDVKYDELRQREARRRLRQRLRRAAAALSLAVLSVVAYLAAADAGFNLPGGARFRTFLDRHRASVLRPVHGLQEIEGALPSLRRDYAEILQKRRSVEGSAGSWVDVWSSMQMAGAVLATPEAGEPERRGFLPLLDLPFAPGTLIEGRGRTYGWVGLEDKDNTQAEPAFWTAIALIEALDAPGLLDEPGRRRATQRLLQTQEVLKLYRPSGSGGWNKFVDQSDPSFHSTYATALALLTLLEAKRAGLPWEGSAETRDALLRSAARWLTATYDAAAAQPGWRESGDGRYEVYEGLTLQIYAELLAAEAEAGVTIPGEILRRIPLQLAALDGRDLDLPDESGEFSADITDHRGMSYNATAADTFLWYPWAIQSAALWLKRERSHPGPPEERVRVERALGYLTLGIGRTAIEKAAVSEWTFVAAETLYVLATTPPLRE